MVIAAMMASAQAASASPAQPSFVVVGAPITPYVRAIVGSAGKVDDLLSPVQDLHEISLSPSQMAKLSKADALVIPDMSISPSLAALAKKLPTLNMIELTKIEGASPLPYPDKNPWIETLKEEAKKQAQQKKPNPFEQRNRTHEKHKAHEEHEHTHQHAEGGIDPHLWLDPERMAAMAVPLAQVMGLTAPDYKKEFTLNAQTLATHLRAEVTPGLRALLNQNSVATKEDKPKIPFITGHAAYQYFITRFDLPYHGEISTAPEPYLGGKTVDILLQAASTQSVRCIVAEAKTTLIARLAKLSGARVVLLQPEQLPTAKTTPPLPWVQNDYDRFLYGIAEGFAGCL
jgi:zinc transport system substrate-binding protein